MMVMVLQYVKSADPQSSERSFMASVIPYGREIFWCSKDDPMLHL